MADTNGPPDWLKSKKHNMPAMKRGRSEGANGKQV